MGVTKRDSVSTLAHFDYGTCRWKVTIMDEDDRLVHYCYVKGWTARTTEQAILLAMKSWRRGCENGVTI